MIVTRGGGVGDPLSTGLGLAPTDDGRLGINVDTLRAPTSDAVGAAFEEAWARLPFSSLQREGELRDAEGRLPRLVEEQRQLREERSLPSLPPWLAPEESPMLTPDEAAERYGHLGLTFDEPVTESFAAILAERKRVELARQLAMSRAEGIVAGVGMFGADIVASMLDPINVGAAFVPVVGQARFLRMVQRMGPTRARVSRGAVEGLAGAALVEPIVLTAALREQADYGVAESLLNIAFGTIVGGGLHVTAGIGADAIARVRGEPTLRMRADMAAAMNGVEGIVARVEAMPMEVRQDMLRVAVAQAMAGQQIDVGLSLRLADTNLEPGTQQRVDADLVVTQDVAPESVTTPRLDTVADPAGRAAQDTKDTQAFPGLTDDQLREIAPALPATAADRSGRVRGRLDQAQATALRRAGVDVDSDGRIAVEDAQRLRDAAAQLGQSGQARVRPRLAPQVERQPAFDAPTLLAEAEHQASPERDAVADLVAAREIDELSAIADDDVRGADEDLAELTSQVAALRQTEELTAEDARALAAADDVAQQAQQATEAYRAAAFCLTGRAA